MENAVTLLNQPAWVMGAATWAAHCALRRMRPNHCDADVEDVAGEVVLRRVAAPSQRWSRRSYALEARDAVRRLYGDGRYGGRGRARHVELDELMERPASGASPEDLALARRRLGQVWPTLTELQRAVAIGYVQGRTPTELGRELGTDISVPASAWKRVVERLVDPGKFRRVASRRLYRRAGGGAYQLEMEA